MEIKNTDIKIEINDEKLFTDVALVVDQDEFTKEIKLLRKTYQKVFKKKKLLSEEEFRTFKRRIYGTKKFDETIDLSRKRLFLPITFRRIIQKAAFCGKIKEGDYLPAYLDSRPSTPSMPSFDKEGNFPDQTYFIVISPGARDNDVIHALQKYRDQLGNIDGIKDYKYIPQDWEVEKGKPAIKKYREWYLASKKGKSPEEIQGELFSKCPHIKQKQKHETKPRLKGCTCYDESTIRKGIATYEKLLWKSRPF